MRLILWKDVFSVTEVAVIDDSEIIELFLARSENAIRQTQLKYGALCLTIAYNVLGNAEDSEECVNDTYLSLWNNIPPDIPENFKAYICRIAKNISLSRLRYNTAKKRSRDSLIPLSDLDETAAYTDGVSDEELGRLISEFLRGQSADVRNVFLRKYWFGDSIADIAKRFSFSQSKVKSMLFQTRKRLQKYLKKEGIDL